LNFRLPKNLGMVVCVGLVTFSLSACGRKGPLEPPPGVPESQAAPFINPTTSGTLDANNSLAAKESNSPIPDAGTPQPQSGAAAGQPAASPVVKPKKTFPLDPLL
jgi:predicted small lipoprotein YifL